MFRGEFAMSMDPKGRVAVPTRYRERLAEVSAGRLVLTISLLERCLVAYPFPEWQRIESSLENLPGLDPQAQAISHLLIGHANDCDLDSHGRVLVPPPLRDFAGLDKRIKVVGQVRKFEIWDDEAWTRRREELLGQIGQLQAQPSEALRNLVL
ncbi:MAG: division/cell wall cluster transcriptional repressor MraZ [Ectothiorhodospiraceae bacterium]|nr:division/cell wall cluster transcriptional repressor MraZ [Ectothiorhodospiraceae bacterium]